MKCPRDQSILNLFDHFHLNCPKCKGDFLLYPDQYDEFLNHFHKIYRPKTLKCPSCEGEMKTLLFTAILLLGLSCTPGEKTQLDVQPQGQVREPADTSDDSELKVNYQTINEKLIKKSCLACHNSRSPRVSFQTRQDVIDNADDIIFYIEQGCDLGACMPPRRADGTPKKPIPSKETVELLKKWVENQFQDE